METNKKQSSFQGYAKSIKNVAERLQVIPLNILLLSWQMNNRNHTSSVPEFLRYYTTIMVSFN